MNRILVRFVSLSTSLLLFACGDGGTGPGDGPGPGNGNTRQILASPAFGANIQEIFERRGCTGSSCHGAAMSANMDLREGAAFANLVLVQAVSEPNFQRVTPNDAQNSYIVIKLEGRQTVGDRMPLNGAALDNIDMTNIRNWISTGAPNN